jgi:hypothetical protein
MGDASNPLAALEAELSQGLRLYWDVAGRIMDGSGIRLIEPAAETFSLKRNFFSALFLYSYFRCGIGPERRVLYAAVNQCLRGMVTGCDNLLDDEYKVTLESDLPETATRFRSVLDIMVSERVLFELLLSQSERLAITLDMAKGAMRKSLHALTLSGAQEATEEAGIEGRRLRPEQVLAEVHHFKTGLLFQCPWAVPHVLEQPLPGGAAVVNDALYRIGIGCQILDDMVDLVHDINGRRHNYVASMIEWGGDEEKRHALAAVAASESSGGQEKILADTYREAYRAAHGHLEKGMGQLFLAEHQSFADAAVAVIVARIGADRLVGTIDPSRHEPAVGRHHGESV